MATAYLVREGIGERATSAGYEVFLPVIMDAFKNVKLHWSSDAPVFGIQKPANAVSDYRFVVVHVKENEMCGQFNKAGYWVLEGVTPSEIMPYLPE